MNLKTVLRYMLYATLGGLLLLNFITLYQQNFTQLNTLTKQAGEIKSLEKQQILLAAGIVNLSKDTDKNFNQIVDVLDSLNSSVGNIGTAINQLNKAVTIVVQKENNNTENISAIKLTLPTEIEKRIKKDKIKQFLLEKVLQQVNVFIENSHCDLATKKSVGCIGSGATIKYKGQYYILTAAHLLQTPEDGLALMENDVKICKLNIIKRDVKNDLMLLQPVDKKLVPKFYVELADMEPFSAQKLYVVGNPAGLEDIVSEGRVALYEDIYMVMRGETYFGNSGGGVYTMDGQLVGIVSAVAMLGKPEEHDGFPAYTVDFMIRLSVINNFLADIGTSVIGQTNIQKANG